MSSLIYLMGPSGAGKDTLLCKLRQSVRPDVCIAQRYITRPNGADAEEHIAVSETQFLQLQARGCFALSWQAHGHYYGIGTEIDQWLANGRMVIVNGSRQYLPQARTRYAGRLHPVCLDVSLPVLAQRLQQRGREDQQQIALRLARAEQYRQTLPADCLYLNNDGELDSTLLAFQALLDTLTKETVHAA